MPLVETKARPRTAPSRTSRPLVTRAVMSPFPLSEATVSRPHLIALASPVTVWHARRQPPSRGDIVLALEPTPVYCLARERGNAALRHPKGWRRSAWRRRRQHRGGGGLEWQPRSAAWFAPTPIGTRST